eukprot:scaffold10889_cov27-Cyclotella_meneghiniana.AAC.2
MVGSVETNFLHTTFWNSSSRPPFWSLQTPEMAHIIEDVVERRALTLPDSCWLVCVWCIGHHRRGHCFVSDACRGGKVGK